MKIILISFHSLRFLDIDRIQTLLSILGNVKIGTPNVVRSVTMIVSSEVNLLLAESLVKVKPSHEIFTVCYMSNLYNNIFIIIYRLL